MTLIIAHKSGWMVADRRTVFGDNLLGPYRLNKIKRGAGILVASSGNGVLGDLIQEALDIHPITTRGILRNVVQVLREKGKELGHALALTSEGICEITSTGGCVWVDADYWAIGSGYQLALGWLAATEAAGEHDIDIEPAHAIDAIDFAATRVNDVGDGHQIERLG